MGKWMELFPPNKFPQHDYIFLSHKGFHHPCYSYKVEWKDEGKDKTAQAREKPKRVYVHTYEWLIISGCISVKVYFSFRDPSRCKHQISQQLNREKDSVEQVSHITCLFQITEIERRTLLNTGACLHLEILNRVRNLALVPFENCNKPRKVHPKQEGQNSKRIFISEIQLTNTKLGENIYKYCQPKTWILIRSKHISRLLLVYIVLRLHTMDFGRYRRVTDLCHYCAVCQAFIYFLLAWFVSINSEINTTNILKEILLGSLMLMN